MLCCHHALLNCLPGLRSCCWQDNHWGICFGGNCGQVKSFSNSHLLCMLCCCCSLQFDWHLCQMVRGMMDSGLKGQAATGRFVLAVVGVSKTSFSVGSSFVTSSEDCSRMTASLRFSVQWQASVHEFRFLCGLWRYHSTLGTFIFRLTVHSLAAVSWYVFGQIDHGFSFKSLQSASFFVLMQVWRMKKPPGTSLCSGK